MASMAPRIVASVGPVGISTLGDQKMSAPGVDLYKLLDVIRRRA